MLDTGLLDQCAVCTVVNIADLLYFHATPLTSLGFIHSVTLFVCDWCLVKTNKALIRLHLKLKIIDLLPSQQLSSYDLTLRVGSTNIVMSCYCVSGHGLINIQNNTY